jgi:hypothetical protein
MLSPFIFAIIMYLFTKNLKAETNRKIGIILSIICIVLLLLRNIEIFIKSGYRIQPEIFPFQICHFANFILLFAFLFKNKTMYTIAFCFNLPFAFLSILFANSLENYQTIINFRGMAYIFGHLLIVGVGLWAYFVDLVQINLKSLSKKTYVISEKDGRIILPKVKYELPANQNRTNPYLSDKVLEYNHYQGVSNLLYAEMRFQNDVNIIKNKTEPVLLKTNGKYHFYCFKLQHLNAETTHFPTLSELLEHFYLVIKHQDIINAEQRKL